MKVNKDLVWLAVGFLILSVISYGISQYYLNKVQAISNKVDAQINELHDWLIRFANGEKMTSPPPQIAYCTYWVLGQQYKYPLKPDVYFEMKNLRECVEIPYVFSEFCFGAGVASLIASLLPRKKTEEQKTDESNQSIII